MCGELLILPSSANPLASVSLDLEGGKEGEK